MNQLTLNQFISNIADKKKCTACFGEYGIVYETRDKDTLEASTKKLDTKYSLKINNVLLSPKYLYKLSCGHNVCNHCFDKNLELSTKNAFGFNCPICKKQLGKLSKKSSQNLIDFEHFGRACFNSLINKYFRINDDLTNMRRVYNNEKNSGLIKADIEKFLVKCGHCPERILEEKKEQNELVAELFCITCYSVYCRKCFSYKHSNSDLHGQLEIGKLSINTVLCMNHKVNLLGYCSDCKVLLCSSCMIKDHKGHMRSEVYNQVEKQTFLEESIKRLIMIRDTNQENFLMITEDYTNLVPKDIPSGLMDQYLYENNLTESANHLKFKANLIQQANYIADILINILTGYSMNPNYILLKRLYDDTESRIRKMVEDYSNLILFENHEPVELFNTTFDINSLKEIDALVDKNNNNEPILKETIRKSMSCLDSISSFSFKTSHSKKSTHTIQREQLTLKPNHKRNEEFEFQSLESDSNSSSKKTDNISDKDRTLQISNESNKSDSLEVNKTYSARLLTFESPSSFSVILSHHIVTKTHIENFINSNYSSETFNKYLTEDDEISIGDQVTYYVNCNTFKTWMRAKVIDLSTNLKNEKEAVIYCLDYGIEFSNVSIKLLKRLVDQSMLEQTPLAIKCYLHNIKPHSLRHSRMSSINKETSNDSIKDLNNYVWFDGIWRHVYDWIGKRSLILKILSKKEHDYYGVDLIDRLSEDIELFSPLRNTIVTYSIDTIILSEMLVRCRMCSFEKEPENFKFNRVSVNDIPRFICMTPLNVNERLNANVSNLKDFKEFYLRRVYPELESHMSFVKLDAKMQSDYSSKLSSQFRIFEPYVGMPVAAVFLGDQRWYRAEITYVHSSSGFVTVYFVDFGNKERVPFENLRYLRNEYFVDEVSSFRCKLFGIRFPDEQGHVKALEYISQIINQKEKLMDILVKDIIEMEDEQDKTLTRNTTKIHEIIIRYPIDNKMTNINVLLTKLGFAEATNLCIFDGEQETKESQNQVDFIKKKPKPTLLETEAQEISKMPNKVMREIKDDNQVLCKVTNALSPNEIWVQDIIDSNSYYPKFQKQFNEHYIELLKQESLSRNEWKVGDLCVLKTKRKLDHYRAKIVEKFPNGYFKLICLDTGNYESSVKPTELFELIDQFKEKPTFKAKKCCLIGIQPTGTNNGVWSSLAQNYTADTLNDNFVHVSFKSDKKDDDSYDTVIYVDTSFKTDEKTSETNQAYIRFAEMLSAKGYGILIEKKIPLDNLLSKNSSFKNTSLVIDQYNMQTYMDVKLPVEIVKNINRKIVKNYDCVVTNVDPNTETIYIRFLPPYQSYDLVERIQSELYSYFESNQPEHFTHQFIKDILKKNIRQACVCKFESNEYYRCEIIDEVKQKDDSAKKKYHVLAVDYGYARKICQDDLYRPLTSHLSIERQIYRFKLTPNLTKYSTQNFTYFLNNVLKNKLVSIEINNIDERSRCVIYGDLNIKSLNLWTSDFITNNKTLNESLFEQDFPRYKPFHVPTSLFFPLQAFTSHVEDYNIVWVQTNLGEIDEMCDYFKDLFTENLVKKLSLEKIEENRQCLCRYTNDGNLYRGQILSVDYFKSKAKVQYVDFGNSEEISFSDIFVLDEKYSQIPKLAIKCRLKNVYLDESGIDDLLKYKQDVINEMNECLGLNTEIYFALFTKANTQQNEFDVEIYINNPHETSNAYLAYQSLVDRGRIEIRDN